MDRKTRSSVNATSKEPNNEHGTGANSVPHIIAIPSNPNANSPMKVLQLSPIQSLPKGKNIKLIKLGPGSTLVNLKMLPQKAQPIQLKIPVQKSAHAPVIVIDPSKSSPSITTTNTSKITATNVSTYKKITPQRISPSKKHQPTITQKKVPSKVPSPIKSLDTTKVAEKLVEIEKKPGSFTRTGSHLMSEVKEIIKSANYKKKRKQDNVNADGNKKRRRRKRKKCGPDSTNKDPLRMEQSLYVADGFRADVETLLEKCSQVYKLNFAKFTDIWQEMKMSRIFHGKQSGAELAEFSEEVIHIAKSYMVAKNISVEENIAGLFLVYALLNLQPFPGWASLRLVPSDVASVLELESVARSQRRHDVLYVLGSVLVRGPVQAHVLAREVAIETSIKKYHDGTIQVSEALESVFTRNADCVQHLKELVHLEQRYHAVRKRLADVPDADKVRRLSQQPASHLLELYRSHIPRGHHTLDAEVDAKKQDVSPEKATEDRIDLMKSIRDKAMKQTVDPMRHLTGVEERLQELPSSSESEDPSPSKRNSQNAYEKTLQDLLFPKNDTVNAKDVPSFTEMPTLDGFGEIGADLDTTDDATNKNNDKPKTNDNNTSNKTDNKLETNDNNKSINLDSPDDESNNNSPILDKFRHLVKTKRKRKVNRFSSVPRRCRGRQMIESDSKPDSIEAEARKNIMNTNTVKRKCTKKNLQQLKRKYDKNSSENDLNRSTDDVGRIETKKAKIGENDNEGRGIEEFTREEEVSYLRSVIEEIEGTIEQDPVIIVNANDKGKKLHVQSEDSMTIELKTIESTPVDCEFEDSKKIKKVDTEKADKKVKTESDKTSKQGDNKNKYSEKIVEIEILPNNSPSTILRTPKTQAKQSDENTTVITNVASSQCSPLPSTSVASTHNTNSPKPRAKPQKITIETLLTPKTIDVSSPNTTETDEDMESATNVSDDKKVVKITNQEYLDRNLKRKGNNKYLKKNVKKAFQKLGIMEVVTKDEVIASNSPNIRAISLRSKYKA